MIIETITIILFFIICAIVILKGIQKEFKKYIRYKAINLQEFQTMAAKMDRISIDREWRKDWKVFYKVYRAAKIARRNHVKKNIR